MKVLCGCVNLYDPFHIAGHHVYYLLLKDRKKYAPSHTVMIHCYGICCVYRSIVLVNAFTISTILTVQEREEPCKGQSTLYIIY